MNDQEIRLILTSTWYIKEGELLSYLMRSEIECSFQPQPETSAMVDEHLGIKQEDPNSNNLSASNSAPGEAHKLNMDVPNGAQQQSGLNSAPLVHPQAQSMAAAVMHSNSLQQQIPALHALRQASPVQQMPNAAALAAVHGSAGVDNNACAVPEFELARRLGVRFDSSNAAWVARSVFATNAIVVFRQNEFFAK